MYILRLREKLVDEGFFEENEDATLLSAIEKSKKYSNARSHQPSALPAPVTANDVVQR